MTPNRCALFMLLMTSILFSVSLLLSTSTTSDLFQTSSRLFSKKPGVNKNDGFAKLPLEPFNMSAFDTIFFYHTRKAGGTSIREYLADVALKHNLSLEAQEGYILKPNHEFNNHTLYITALRDPVERAISSYWFEGRWQGQTNRNNETNITALDFMDWVSWANDTESVRGDFVWHCALDCYCKWFGTRTIVERTLVFDVRTTATRLKRFHLILRTEWMLDKNYTDKIARLLDAEDISMHVRNRGNYTSLYNLSSTDMEYLWQNNKEDRELMSLAFGNL